MQTGKTIYTCGFLWYGGLVALIKKEKPLWQRGKLNGIGGKVEEGETLHQAMEREFKEETALTVTGWYKFCENHGPDYTVHFFVNEVSSATPLPPNVISSQEGEVNWHQSGLISEARIIPNLIWLLPMSRFAWTRHVEGDEFFVTVTEHDKQIPSERWEKILTDLHEPGCNILKGSPICSCSIPGKI